MTRLTVVPVAVDLVVDLNPQEAMCVHYGDRHVHWVPVVGGVEPNLN